MVYSRLHKGTEAHQQPQQQGTEMELNIEQLAKLAALRLAATAPVKGARKGVEPGSYNVDQLVRIKGEVRIGEDHEAMVAASAPWRDIAISLLGKVNSAVRAKTLREILEAGEPCDAAELKAEVEDAVREVMGTTVKTVSGRMTGSVEMEVL
jgi:hypothetical protein